ncbi:MAG: hypothetical protein QF775_00490 [archaeon]|jgi:hypothetical protein|nr:hypothetical protein [archaeon]
MDRFEELSRQKAEIEEELEDPDLTGARRNELQRGLVLIEEALTVASINAQSLISTQ